MNKSKPLIFISNDDGVEVPGLRHLIECVKDLGEIIAVAPLAPRSGQSSAITVDAPLRIKECPGFDGAKVYSVSGTPVDCVKLGLHALVSRKPDIMLSGV
ncbi:MAG: 5'/3'-nucleotidase SurE, partial [Paramuribaculum sp.]|nr:5'/3'-nucleotidase SurE [Paramuribaculum sp.]